MLSGAWKWRCEKSTEFVQDLFGYSLWSKVLTAELSAADRHSNLACICDKRQSTVDETSDGAGWSPKPGSISGSSSWHPRWYRTPSLQRSSWTSLWGMICSWTLSAAHSEAPYLETMYPNHNLEMTTFHFMLDLRGKHFRKHVRRPLHFSPQLSELLGWFGSKRGICTVLICFTHLLESPCPQIVLHGFL